MQTTHSPQWPTTIRWLGGLLAVSSLTMAAPAETGRIQDVPFPVVERFENFGKEQGIPSEKVHAVLRTSEGKLWIGTWDGLCLLEQNGRFRRYGPEHGLSHKLVLCLVEDPKSGDLWIATMRGLNRFSGGKFTSFTQTDSGLPNNVVYGVDVVGDTVWAATAAGTGAYDQKTGTWKIYDHNNTLMHEPWCYVVKGGGDKVFVGAWGGGILEHDPARESWKEHRDPDRDFHYDLVPDDGPINDIVSWLDWEDGILWQCTYFGMARYDGRNWKTWVEKKSPLLSNFTQFVRAHRRVAWIGMDRGVSVTDGSYWVNYTVDDQGRGLVEIHRPGKPAETRTQSTALANRFVLGIHVDDTEAWFATSHGLSRGVLSPATRLTKLADAGAPSESLP